MCGMISPRVMPPPILARSPNDFGTPYEHHSIMKSACEFVYYSSNRPQALCTFSKRCQSFSKPLPRQIQSQISNVSMSLLRQIRSQISNVSKPLPRQIQSQISNVSMSLFRPKTISVSRAFFTENRLSNVSNSLLYRNEIRILRDA